MDHPIQNILTQYYMNFDAIKENHSDLNNLMFHNNYGLSIKCPIDWPWIESSALIATDAVESNNKMVLIIYDTTITYDSIKNLCPNNNNIRYISWHEIFTSMSINESSRQEIKTKISSSDLIFFLGASTALSDVVNWVKSFCSSCLIILR